MEQKFITIIDINRLGPAAQKQVFEQLASAERKKLDRQRAAALRDRFESNGERNFYAATVMPMLHNGQLIKCDLHREFELYPETIFDGTKFPRAVFKPDFVLQYSTGSVEVVEIKSKFTKRKSRDYTLRRRLFIELYARPAGWHWREIVTDMEG